jgi:ubiquinol-cytochrome c reductase cytochrome c1 subunit
MMKKLFIALLWVPLLALAAGAELHLDKAPDRGRDLPALQNGAKVFINYCLNCHSASYMRYNRLQDIGLTEQQIKDNLMFTQDKVGELMTIAMRRSESKQWFGAAPPDLTVIARARASEFGSGSDWLYTYLRGFYRDDSRPTGWNNTVFANVGMPHVLWELQGEQVMGPDHKLQGIRCAGRRPGRLPELHGRASPELPQGTGRHRPDRPCHPVCLLLCTQTRVLARHSLTE